MGLGGGAGGTPWTVDLDGNNILGFSSAGTSVVNDSVCLYCGYLQSGGTQNDHFDWPVMLGAGTWTIALMCVQAGSGGIVTVQLDDGAGNFTTAGTMDLYAASIARNIAGVITGIIVGSTGKKTLRLNMLTKNASSSGYRLFLQHIALLRTA